MSGESGLVLYPAKRSTTATQEHYFQPQESTQQTLSAVQRHARRDDDPHCTITNASNNDKVPPLPWRRPEGKKGIRGYK